MGGYVKRILHALCTGALMLMGWNGMYAQSSGYHIIDSLTLGGEGGWDYLTVDTTTERLYLSRGMRAQIIDLARLSIVGEVPNTPGIHGVALTPALNRGYTSNGRDSSVTIFDLRTLTTLEVLKIDGRNPDAILFDLPSQRLFTFNGGSANATVIDVATDSIVGLIPLGGKPEFAVSDNRRYIYVNIEDRSSIAEIDPRALKVTRTWSLAPGEEPSGLAIDRASGRLFSACANKLMVVSDITAGKVMATVPIGAGVDGAAYDPASRLVFSSNGEGTMTVVRETSPGRFTVVDNVVTRRGARTCVLDEKTGRMYTVSAKFGPPPAPTAEQPRPRPAMISGSQTLYVICREGTQH
jgi:DNA-binding beta-propeller fold protein YncE